MHIPDGYLSDPVCLATAAASTAAVTWSVLKLRCEANRAQAAQMAAVGAGIFAVHMVNVPIDHGTSGHLVGAAAAAVLLGPWAATLTMAVVLALECVLFADGGFWTLGANVLNMAVLAPWLASVILSRAVPGGRFGRLQFAGVAGGVSVLLAATACAWELCVSGAGSLAQVLPAMLASYALVGIGEGCLTIALAACVRKRVGFENRWVPAGIVLALALGVLAAPWASALPDGLQQVTQSLNFAAVSSVAGTSGNWAMLAPDYLLPGIAWQPLAVALAAVLGIAAVFLTTYGAGRLTTVKVRRSR